MWLYILSAVFFVLIIYFYLIKPLRYWKERHVNVSAIPIFGSCLSLLTRQRSNIDFFNYVYNKYPNERYVGMFLMTEPVLVIRDPNLFKEIFIKEFKTFPNRRMTVPLEVDHLWSENLFSIGPAHKWHRLRNILNPRFSSGKLKSMFSEITQNAKMLLDNRYDEDGIAEIESKEASFMYAFEVSFKLLFDFNIEKSNDFKSKLRDAMKELIDFRGIKGLMVNLKFHPILLKITKTAIVGKTLGTFLSNLIKQTIKERKQKNIVKQDMLQMLIETQDKDFSDVKHQDNDFKITPDIITSQLVIFGFTAVDTVSTILSYAIYELAINPNIQIRLQNEVDVTKKECNGTFTYGALKEMKYLDMVISEVLRKWPPFLEANRVSVKSYTIKAENSGERDVFLDKNTTIILPIGATHYNPKYFPNPEKFDPERFSQENAKNIVPYTFAPFGHGPRNCIALRFALLEVKIGLVEILKECNIVQTARTKVPLTLNKDKFNPLPDDGIWIGLEKRNLK